MNDYEEVTIRIARGLIPAGYEADVFRVPNEGETYITDLGQFAIARSGVCGPRLILRRKWEWPPWLKCDRIKWSDTLGWYGQGDTHQARIAFEFLDWPEPPDRSKVYTNPKNS